MFARLVFGLVLVESATGQAVAADAAADFFKDKQMKMIVPTSAGGLYDLMTRLLSEHMPRHIPGQPRVIVQHMNGASGLVAANYMVNIAPKDGTVIAAAHGATITASLYTPEQAKFKSNELVWLGSVTKDPFVAYTYHTSPVKTLDDLRRIEAPFGGSAPGSATIDYAIFAREMFGFKIKIITGYQNSVNVKLAMERGELAGTFGNGWSSLKTGEPDWIRDKKINILTQFGLTKHRDLPDVPLFIDLAQNDEDRRALELVFARQDISRPYYVPPGTPADRVEVLRKAFDETMVDKEFLAAAEKAQAPVDGPLTGKEVAAVVNRIISSPPELVKRMQGYLAKYQN
jgi:tripartite-type tricarboxylate transporter receptor subunit TctC